MGVWAQWPRIVDISLTQQSDPMDDPLTQLFWEKGRGLVP